MEIKNIYTRLKLKARKNRALLEVRTDIRFIKKYRSRYLEMSISDKRKALAEERAKRKPDEAVIEKLSTEIAKRNATVKEYEQLLELEQDLVKYIDLI